jgi:hypothetical protein
MSASDLGIYRSYYCESCHQLRRNFGLVSTAAVNYDMTFNGIVLNSVSPDGIKEQNTGNGMICILGKSTDSELLKKMAGYTILLTKWELEDDKGDRPTIRSNMASIALGRAIRKAERIYPEYDEHVGRGFDILRGMESRGHTDAAAIGRTFASSLMPAMRDIAGNIWNNDLEGLFLGLGTMIYVMDAVDDLDEDYMNDTFNPFLHGCDDFVSKETFVRKNLYAITDIMNSAMKDVQTPYSFIRGSMRFHHGVCDNVIYSGIPDSVRRVISCGCVSRPGLANTISSRLLRRNE